MRRITLFLAILLVLTSNASAKSLAPRPDEVEFRSLYKELVETNTTLSVGSCTDAAAKMGRRLKAAGFSDSELTTFTAPDHPREGGLVAKLPGSDASLKPILLLAHIDVVEANREDWARDPFTLTEENGFFFARGTADDKAQAAIWTDTLIRLRQAHDVPKRGITMALTCGEEGAPFNGAKWLAQNRPDLIAAEFALNEGGGGMLDAAGNRQMLLIQAGEKASRDFKLEVTNPGGHSSRPMPDNAIYDLAKALNAVQHLDFPVRLNDTTRGFLAHTAAKTGGKMGAAITALLANPNDAEAEKTVSSDPTLRTMLKTTCVATMISGGHAANALPQRATANTNCRIIPGDTTEATQAALVQAIANPKVAVTLTGNTRPMAKLPPLTPAILGPAEELGKKYFPGVPLIPVMISGATDGTYIGLVDVPTYGVPGIFVEPDFNGLHGLNERMRMRSLMEGRDYLFDLVNAYAAQ